MIVYSNHKYTSVTLQKSFQIFAEIRSSLSFFHGDINNNKILNLQKILYFGCLNFYSWDVILDIPSVQVVVEGNYFLNIQTHQLDNCRQFFCVHMAYRATVLWKYHGYLCYIACLPTPQIARVGLSTWEEEKKLQPAIDEIRFFVKKMNNIRIYR